MTVNGHSYDHISNDDNNTTTVTMTNNNDENNNDENNNDENNNDNENNNNNSNSNSNSSPQCAADEIKTESGNDVEEVSRSLPLPDKGREEEESEGKTVDETQQEEDDQERNEQDRNAGKEVVIEEEEDIFSFSSTSDEEEYFDALDEMEQNAASPRRRTPISSLLIDLKRYHAENGDNTVVTDVVTVENSDSAASQTPPPAAAEKTADASKAGQQSVASIANAPSDPNDPEYDSCMLKSFVVKNLDTGEVTSLYETDQSINPIYSVLISRVKDYEDASEGSTSSSTSSSGKESQLSPQEQQHRHRSKGRMKYLKKLFKPKTSPSSAHHEQQQQQQKQQQQNPNAIPVFSSGHSKKKHGNGNILGELEEVQRIEYHTGAIWSMKLTPNGQYLATGGQDGYCVVWKINRIDGSSYRRLSTSFKKTNSVSQSATSDDNSSPATPSSPTSSPRHQQGSTKAAKFTGTKAIIHPVPFRKYLNGDSGDILDLNWSKSNFLITSSMDKNVRVFHISREECLVTFVHAEIVTGVKFCKDESFFITGSFDEKLRLFNLRQKQLIAVVDTNYMITAVGLSEVGDRSIAFAGTYDGKCCLYDMSDDGFVKRTVIDVRSRRGKNRGRKVTGIVISPDREHVLVTTNDSRVRLYSLRDYSEVAKFQGLENQSSQVKATFNPTGELLISGSENNSVYFWNNSAHVPPAANSSKSLPAVSSRSSSRRSSITTTATAIDPTTAAAAAKLTLSNSAKEKPRRTGKIRNSNYEYFTEPFESVVTNALFLPERRSRKDKLSNNAAAGSGGSNAAGTASTSSAQDGAHQGMKNFFTLVSDFHGKLYVFENKHIDAH